MYEIFLNTWWGRALIVVGVFACVYGIWVETAEGRFFRRIKNNIKRLAPFMRGLDWKAVEWRSRMAAETFEECCKSGEFGDFLTHCTEEFGEEFEVAVVEGFIGEKFHPMNSIGALPPVPVYVRTPSEGRPATVGVLVRLRAQGKLNPWGVKEQRWLYHMVYDSSGDWKCDALEVIDSSALIMKQVEPSLMETDCLEAYPQPAPSTATLWPEAPEHARHTGPFNALLLVGVTFLVVTAGLIGAYFIEVGQASRAGKLGEGDVEVSARVDSHAWSSAKDYCTIKYSFSVEGDEENVIRSSGWMGPSSPRLNAEDATVAVSSGRVSVLYDSENPKINRLLKQVNDPASTRFEHLLLAVLMIFGSGFTIDRALKTGGPKYWIGWNRFG